jgi:hypothetical protein
MSGRKSRSGVVRDGAVQAAPQTFVPESIAAKRASLLPVNLHRWLEKAQTPNGWPLIVRQDTDTKEFSLAEESVTKLENRFVDAMSGKPAGPRHFSAFPPLYPRTRFTGDDSKLLPFDEAIASFKRQFGPDASETLRKWCAEGHGPKKLRMQLIRDPINNKLYVGQASLAVAQSLIAVNR